LTAILLFVFIFYILACTMTNMCKINLQFITLLLHVSTLLCHPQGARSSTLPGYTHMCQLIVHLLVIIQNNKRCTVQVKK